ncbi:hypothetical protein [Xylella fastidiosa]|nr:hypothetical protein [Xylella fastidiosa]MDG5822572.1 hypothetical protein [Xylella fastidiosa subsp. pauca]MDG5826067.1 hypothetical protein [Xylella fastidiosa subsp. pauca]WGZ31723.1 hypothetical protein O4444_09515 [Xylella fastidiosa subsp. pauca]WGZ33987.1 hypothetical protein O4445_10110 [Xylella fastidiosa subsp. pauca]WGZ36302.1 hypothetical protein O4443_10060 [Xylella fastidiosa subsp. pauca]
MCIPLLDVDEFFRRRRAVLVVLLFDEVFSVPFGNVVFDRYR